MGLQLEPAAVSINKGVPFAALELLAGEIAPLLAAALGGLDSLAVDDGRRRARFRAPPWSRCPVW